LKEGAHLYGYQVFKLGQEENDHYLLGMEGEFELNSSGIIDHIINKSGGEAGSGLYSEYCGKYHIIRVHKGTDSSSLKNQA
jgi:hypothetical protein